MTCAICGCRDDDACPEVCSWAEDAPAGVPLCDQCLEIAAALGGQALELARKHGRPDSKPPRSPFAGNRRGVYTSSAFAVGWSLLAWLTLEAEGPGATIDRWAQAEPWAAEPGGLLAGRKVWWKNRGSNPPKAERRRKGVAKR